MMGLKKLWDHKFFETEEGLKLIEKAKMWYKRLAPVAITNDSLTLSSEMLRRREKPDSSIIIDDLLAFSKTPLMLMAYFVAILEVFIEHRVSIRLRKTRFLPS